MSERSALQGVGAQEEDQRAEWLRDPETRFILFCGERALLETDPPIRPILVTPAGLTNLRPAFANAVHLGAYETGPLLALDLEEANDGGSEGDLLRGRFRGLRSIQEPVDSATWELLSRARALLAWNRLYVACPACGSATTPQRSACWDVSGSSRPASGRSLPALSSLGRHSKAPSAARLRRRSASPSSVLPTSVRNRGRSR
jgi:NADH pyrophosphatase NudC (nudix superfamily)